MVYIVRKQIGKNTYLYLNKSIYNKGKRTTHHVKYLGSENKFTKDELKEIIDNYKRGGKYENIRTRRQRKS